MNIFNYWKTSIIYFKEPYWRKSQFLLPSFFLLLLSVGVCQLGFASNNKQAIDPGNETLTLLEDTPSTTENVLANNSDPSGGPMTLTPPANSLQGATVTYNPVDSTFDYTPIPNFCGLDRILYQVCDNNSSCIIDTVFVNVICVDDPPTQGNEVTSTDEDTPLTTQNLLFNNIDVDGAVRIPIAPSNGIQGGSVSHNAGANFFNYTPAPDFNGIDTVAYIVCDNATPSPNCLIDSIFITVNPVNDAPAQGNEILTGITQGTTTPTTSSDLTTNNVDPDGTMTTIATIVSNTGNGTTTITGNGTTINYTPAANFYGIDSVVYTICDAGLPTPILCVNDTIFVTVDGLNAGTGCVTINTAVWLEGAFESGSMHTKLNDLGYLPGQKPATFFGTATAAGQPYNIIPWNYAGTEGNNMVYTANDPKAGYPATAVDWGLVSLRTAADRGSTVCTRAGLLHSDGTITFIAGTDCCNVDLTATYYLVVEHRNHLIVMSDEKVTINNGELTYDFRTQESYKASFGFGQKQIAPGVFAMHAGNGNQAPGPNLNGMIDINNQDKETWLEFNGKNSKYYIDDFDLNGDVSVQDKGLWLKNFGRASDVPWDD